MKIKNTLCCNNRLFRASALILSVLLALSCVSCTPQADEPEPESQLEQYHVYESPYDWSCLIYEDGRFSYTKDWVPASLTGIDVSVHQGWIDWSAVANDGIDFAIIQLGYRGFTDGELSLDERFYSNVEAARNAGIKVGVYFFSQAIDEEEALEEAQLVIRALEGIPLDYPVFFDHETVSDERGRANHLSNKQVTQNAQVFCEHIEANGYVPMLYGNKKAMGKIDVDLRDRYGVWFAEYDVTVPSAQFDFIMWQYSSSGIVAGIDTSVDMNIHFLYP